MISQRLLPALFASLTSLTSFATAPELIWEIGGLTAPESAIYDEVREVIYVSNMGTRGKDAQPGDGFISRLSPNGELLELKWVTGMENPKGITLANGRLYVGDDAALIEIDINAGKIVGRYAPAEGESAGFNDVTADPAGNVYVCSGRSLTLFRLHDGKFDPWLTLDRAVTGGLNGLRAENDRLLLGGWTVKDAAGEESLGHLSTVNLADKSVGRLGHQPISHIDGIEPDGVGGYTVTDWITGDVNHVTGDGVPTLLMSLGQGTADHEYVVEQKMLIMPSMLDGKVRAFKWAPPTPR